MNYITKFMKDGYVFPLDICSFWFHEEEINSVRHVFSHFHISNDDFKTNAQVNYLVRFVAGVTHEKIFFLFCPRGVWMPGKFLESCEAKHFICRSSRNSKISLVQIAPFPWRLQSASRK